MRAPRNRTYREYGVGSFYYVQRPYGTGPWIAMREWLPIIDTSLKRKHMFLPGRRASWGYIRATRKRNRASVYR